MSIRAPALACLRLALDHDSVLRARLGMGRATLSTAEGRGRVLASKLYPPHESWTRAPAWWFQVPVDKTAGDGHLLLLAARPASGFHLLAVERGWLRDVDRALVRIETRGVYNLFLDATAGARFLERRGEGVDFARFHLCDLEQGTPLP